MKQLDQLKEQHPHQSYGQMIVNALDVSWDFRDFKKALSTIDDSKFIEALERYGVFMERENRPWKTRHSRE